ncbi:hypothetical protein OAQ34_01765 [Opitutales bacterium]|nr:hypothetical protein [Opitutales bacterium]
MNVMSFNKFQFCAVAVLIFAGSVYGSELSESDLLSEKEALRRLPKEWHNVKHLKDGFPEGFKPKLYTKVPIENGGVFDLTKPPTEEQLAELKKRAIAGDFFQSQAKAKMDPVTGDRFLEILHAGEYSEWNGHTQPLMQFLSRNPSAYLILYRISFSDPYYLDQLIKFADGVKYLLENQPIAFSNSAYRENPPADAKKDRGAKRNTNPDSRYYYKRIDAWRAKFKKDPKDAIPMDLPSSNVPYPLASAARLLLERVLENNGASSDPDYIKALDYIDTSIVWLDSIVRDAPPEEDVFINAGGNGGYTRFRRTKDFEHIVNKYDISERLAAQMNHTAWNRTNLSLPVYAHLSTAIKLLMKIDPTTKPKYERLAKRYEHIVLAWIDLNQIQNDCSIKDGDPYLFRTYHTRGMDQVDAYVERLGHPMFQGEDLGHFNTPALKLPFVWEAGSEYCSEAVMAGYVNALTWTRNSINLHATDPEKLLRFTMTPWTQAAHFRNFKTTEIGSLMNLKYGFFSHYNPTCYLVTYNQIAKRTRDKVTKSGWSWSQNYIDQDLTLHFSGYLLRETMRRRANGE